MNVPYGTAPPDVCPLLLAEFNAGTRRAIVANHSRVARENHLESMWIFNEPAKKAKR